MDVGIPKIGLNDPIEMLCYENIINDVLLLSRKYGLCECFVVKGGVALTKILSSVSDVKLTTRSTVDLDLHWFMQYKDKWEYFVANIADILNTESIYGFNYKLLSRRGYSKNPNGDSVKLQVSVDGCFKPLKFKIDMNLGSHINNVIRHDGVDLYPVEYMLADKLCVIINRTIYRRCKDLIDVYNLTYYKNFNYNELIETMQKKRDIKSLNLKFILCDLDRQSLAKSYNCLTRIKYKPDLSTVLQRVLDFIIPLLTKGVPVSTWHVDKGWWL